MVPIGLVYSIHDSTEVAIQKMIDASQRMIDVQSPVEGEAKDGWGLYGYEETFRIRNKKTLQNASRHTDRLEALLRARQIGQKHRGYDSKEVHRVYL
jgi:hypothetical protein